MGTRTYRTVLIGAGNVATHLGRALSESGHNILQVYSRSMENARVLAAELHADSVCDLARVNAEAELYVLVVKDDALPDVAATLHAHLLNEPLYNEQSGSRALFVHTAGSVPMDVLPMFRRGVLYPMQTFSRNREVIFRSVPLFVESDSDMRVLREIADSLSDKVYELDSQTREYLHLAAVFACNFTNHMYGLCAEILASKGVPFDVMLSLTDETARKVHELSPDKAQTGPAVRGDERIMQHHLSLLGKGTKAEIYKLLSQSIHDKL